MPDGENPRWTQCRKAIGREIRALDFILWMSGKWTEFARESGVDLANSPFYEHSSRAFLKFGDDTHRLFDRWLAAGVAAGRWTADPMHPERNPS